MKTNRQLQYIYPVCDQKNLIRIKSDCLTVKQLSTDLIVLQTADHELGEDDHSGATHPSAAVHHHRWVEAL